MRQIHETAHAKIRMPDGEPAALLTFNTHKESFSDEKFVGLESWHFLATAQTLRNLSAHLNNVANELDAMPELEIPDE